MWLDSIVTSSDYTNRKSVYEGCILHAGDGEDGADVNEADAWWAGEERLSEGDGDVMDEHANEKRRLMSVEKDPRNPDLMKAVNEAEEGCTALTLKWQLIAAEREADFHLTAMRWFAHFC